jgi:hypothetical protein
MFWLQGLVSFAIWIVFGIVYSRRSRHIRAYLFAQSRGRRVAIGAISMIGGSALLFGTLVALHATGGFTSHGMTPLSWLLITGAGLVFVYSQTLAMAVLVTLVMDGVVTSSEALSSDHQGQDVAQP